MITGLHPNHVALLARPEVDEYLVATFAGDDTCWAAFLGRSELHPYLDLSEVADIAAEVLGAVADTRFRFLERAINDLTGPVTPAEGEALAAAALAAADTVLRITARIS